MTRVHKTDKRSKGANHLFYRQNIAGLKETSPHNRHNLARVFQCCRNSRFIPATLLGMCICVVIGCLMPNQALSEAEPSDNLELSVESKNCVAVVVAEFEKELSREPLGGEFQFRVLETLNGNQPPSRLHIRCLLWADCPSSEPDRSRVTSMVQCRRPRAGSRWILDLEKWKKSEYEAVGYSYSMIADTAENRRRVKESFKTENFPLRHPLPNKVANLHSMRKKCAVKK